MNPASDTIRLRKPFHWSGWPLILLLTLSLVLRITGLGERSYFNDELSAIFRTQVSNFDSFVEESVVPDFHPAGVQWFLWQWVKVVGTGSFAVRLPFALAGTFSVWILFLLGRFWFGEKTAWLAAVSLAFLQFPIHFSQLARPYSTGLLFVLLATYFFARLTQANEKSGGIRYGLAAAAGVSCALAMYNHYFSFFVAGVAGLAFLPLQKKNTLMPFLVSGFLAIALFLPHFNISRIQLLRGGLSSWLPPPEPVWFKEHILYLFNESRWVSAMFMLFLIPLALKLLGRPIPGLKRGRVYFSGGLYIGSLAFAYLYSVLVNPILQNSIMLFVFPFLLLALFFGIGSLSERWFRPVGILLPVLLLTHLLFGACYYRYDQYSDFRTNAKLLCEVFQEHPDAAWVAQVNDPWYLHFYMDPMCKPDSALTYLVPDRDALLRLDKTLDTLSSDHLAFTWLRPFDPMITSVIRFHYPYLVTYHTTRFYDEFYHFSKYPPIRSADNYPYDTIPLKTSSSVGFPVTIQPENEFIELYNGSVPPRSEPFLIPLLLHCDLRGTGDTSLTGLQLVTTLESRKGEVNSWTSLPASFLDHKGRNFFFTQHLPWHYNNDDRLKIFLWNPDQESYILNRCMISFILPKE